MTPERWEQISEIYQSALELESRVERASFLEKMCADDEELRREIESLLEADAAAGSFIADHALKDAPSLLTVKGSLDGQTLGHYRIISRIGVGGMGEVYLAEDTRLNRLVAVKTLPPALAANPAYLKRFQTEAKAAATLNHPHIATVYSVEDIDGRQFIAMEYVEGDALDEAFGGKPLNLKTFLDWFAGLADALALAHEKGVIHRDIKPGNIMISKSNVPKILDFGLAQFDRRRVAHDASTLDLTQPGQILGTPAYMSPEQAEGEPIDRRSDIFSFGIVMYEALSGERPFKGESYASIISSLLTREPPQISELNPETPYLLARLVTRCLNKDRRYRFQSMQEVRVILEEVRAAVEANASVARPARAFLSAPKKFPAAAVYALTVLLVLSGALAGWLWFQTKQTGINAVTRFSVAPPAGIEIRLFEAKISPDGRKIVFASRQNDLKTLFLRSLDDFRTTPIPGTENGKQPFFSADGEWIGFFLDGDKMKKAPVGGGTALTICDACDANSEAFWSANGAIIAADRTGLYRVSAEGGIPERLIEIDAGKGEKSFRAPQVLPGGKAVLFSVETAQNVVFSVLSLETGDRRRIENVEGSAAPHGAASLARYAPTGHLVFSRASQLFAAGFDLEKFEITNAPVPVLEGVFALPNFQIADDGTLVYLPETTTEENLLVWVDRTGKASPALEKRANYRSPRLSPDGGSFAVQIDDDIWVYETATGRGVRVTFDGENQSPLWTPDGEKIIYASKKENLWTIYEKPVGETGEAKKLFTSDNRHLPYSMHPTGKILALATIPGANDSDLAFLYLNDDRLAPFLQTEFKEDTPRFSPDGRWIAYFSTESGRIEVYVQPFGGAAGKIPVSKDGGMFPVWSPAGNELFYRLGDKLIATGVKAGSNFDVGEKRILFEGRYQTSFDAAADGKKFLMVENKQGSLPQQLNVILNWTEELERTLGSDR